jgi:hypothetical protein
MPESAGIRRTPEEPAANGRRRLASPLRWERAVLGMLRAGLTTEQISRLADLHIRLRRGARADDGETWPQGALALRRLEFVRWLVQTGRLRDR